ncbi:S1 RNA-binding domain-containing protein [Streptomyces sp. NPDC005813]|uniref:S1 RNA-binding domain-containing protein n=1 Tax=Streptomyces sp. NPDC005813 TaxID=3155592 RepID=UPI0034004753
MRLAPGIEGLLHVSEIADSSVESPDQLVSEGDQITVRVAEVDLQRHRVRLSTHDSYDNLAYGSKGASPDHHQ